MCFGFGIHLLVSKSGNDIEDPKCDTHAKTIEKGAYFNSMRQTEMTH